MNFLDRHFVRTKITGEIVDTSDSHMSINEKDFNLSSSEFEKLLEENNSVLIDVRTFEEYVLARIPDSVLYDIYQPDFLQKIDALDRSGIYMIYCRSGNRSRTACVQMIKMGFERVFHLKEGIIGWRGKIVGG